MDGGVMSLIAGLPHPDRTVLPVYVWLDRQGRAVQIAASATLETEPSAPLCVTSRPRQPAAGNGERARRPAQLR